MIHTLILRTPVLGSLLLGAILCWLTAKADAYTISLTGGFSDGNPGGQPLYEVSGLVQGDAFNVSWGGVSGLSVTGMVIVDSLTNTDADIRVMLDNLSTPLSGNDPRATSFGMDVEAFTSFSNTSTSGTYLDDAFNSNFPGFGVLQCASSGSNCAGGGSSGIPAGGSDDFTLEVNGNFLGVLKLSDFALKVQGGPNGGSFELAGVPTPKVPEPMTIALALIGAVALWVRRRPQR